MKQLIILVFCFSRFVNESKAATCGYRDEFIDYTCFPFIANSTTESPFNIVGVHLSSDKTDSDVTDIFALNSTIENFPNEIFQKFINLKKLHLHDVGMKTINEPLVNCGNLLIFDTRTNEISSIVSGAFINCANLSEIWLAENHLASIGEIFLGVEEVYGLVLDNNLITDIGPDDFKTLKKLTSLALRYNSISNIHPEAFRPLEALQYVYLDRNSLTHIEPRLFDNALHLLHFSAQYNQITNIEPGTFAQSKDIGTIILDYNQLKSIDQNTFSGLSNLTFFALIRNEIESIHENAFDGLNKLEELYLQSNVLTTIESTTFSKLESLVWLQLFNNTISHIDPQAFSDIAMLNRLNLQSNKLDDLSFLKGLGNVTSLDLSDNLIVELEPMTFSAQTKLESLRLISNQIKTLFTVSFGRLQELETLYVSNNQIETIDEDFFENFPKLQEFWAEGNVCINQSMDSISPSEILSILLQCSDASTAVINLSILIFTGIIFLWNIM